MDWILRSLFIFVMVTTYSKCKKNFGHNLTEDFPQYQYDHAEYNPLFQRLKHQSSRENYPRMIGRSAETTSESTNEGPNTSVRGKAQEQENARIESRIVEPVIRLENGSDMALHYPSITNRSKLGIGSDASSVKDRIVLTGPTSIEHLKPDIPEECRRIGICSDVPHYPTQLVERALAKLGDLTGEFQIDELDVSETPDITQRIGDPAWVDLCYSKPKLIYPKGAVNKDGNLVYIVNNDKNPLQGVIVEECDIQKNNGSCIGVVSFTKGFSSQCIQKNATRMLWALENDTVVKTPISIACCCQCVATKIGVVVYEDFQWSKTNNEGYMSSKKKLGIHEV